MEGNRSDRSRPFGRRCGTRKDKPPVKIFAAFLHAAATLDSMCRTGFRLLVFLKLFSLGYAATKLPDGWQTAAPRDELRPAFAFEPKGGPLHTGSFLITHDRREGLDGWFQKTFIVHGG